MPFLERDDVRIHYAVHGDGPPLLALAPGGMSSEMSRWDALPWHPVDALSSCYTVILMDQRNAGRSTAPIDSATGWRTYGSDQLAVLDHLGIERCQVLGCCIGCSFLLGLIELAPQRIAAGVLMQPIGASATNDQAFRHLFGGWLETMRDLHPSMTESDWNALHERLFGGDFVFNVSRDFVRGIDTPLLILAGTDEFHPPATSFELAKLVSNVTFIEQWKDAGHIDQAAAAIEQFLRDHPVS